MPLPLSFTHRSIVKLPIFSGTKAWLGAEKSARTAQVRWTVAGSSADMVTLWDEHGEQSGQRIVVDLPLLAPTPGDPSSSYLTDSISLQYHWVEGTLDMTQAELKAVICLAPPLGTPDSLTACVRSEHNPDLVDIQHRSLTLNCVPTFSPPENFETAPCVAVLVFSPGAPVEVSKFWLSMLRECLELPT